MGARALPADLRDRVKAMWLEGQSAGLIGNRLGITSNSVIGLVHRMKLPPRVTKERLPVYNAPKRVQRPKKPKPTKDNTGPKPPMPVVDGPFEATGFTLLSVGNHQCRWPFGLPSAEMPVCGKPAPRGPYCADHILLAFDPRKKQGDAAQA